MANARQQYQADWSYVDKQNKEFTLTQEIIEKLDSIEPGAERNFIQWIKRNWVLQEPDQYRVVNLTIADVVDDLNSTDRTNALSARQGRILYNYIQNLQSLGKFLSNWNSATWLPTTNPSTLPYDYHSGDYFIVSVVWATNYKPTWSQFDWTASTTVETEEVKVGDFYMYDWTEWLLLVNTERDIPIDTSLSTTSTNPVENRVVTNAINTKQDTLVAGNNIQIASDWKTISATDTTYSAWTNISIDANNEISAVDTTYTAWTNVQISNNNVISATDTVYWAWNNIQISAQNIISATDTTYTDTDFDISLLSDNQGKRAEWDAKQDALTAWSNIQINWTTISATDTTYTASDFDIKDLTDSTNLRTTWSWKQNALTAWTNIQISWDTISATDTKYTAGANVQISSWNVISATDTTYTASDFDIKDIADSTSLRTTWSGKQDKLQAGTNIQIANDWKTISATDTKYTAWTWINIDANNVISNTQTSAERWNITWTLSDQTDLNNALWWKQDTLIAWTNIQIANDGKTISATDTTYTAWTNIQISWTTISATDTTYTAWTNVQISSSNVISATDTITEVDDSLSSTSTTHALSAAQGKILNDKIADLQAMGKFLSTWDASSWQPTTFPYTTPYTYHTWDYFLVSAIDTTSPIVNYKPNGSSYTWSASTTQETWDLAVWDIYIYDGAVWILQMNHWKEISFANITWQPNDNTALATALGGKQDALATQTAYTSKWSATKVPQITTNSLGQVTWITEVTITHPSQVSDTAYASSWDWVTTTAPSQNAVYDKISAMDTTISWKQDTLVSGMSIKTINSTSLLWSGDISITSANNSTISFTQWGDNIDSFTTNASSAKTIALRGDIFLTQTSYDNLPSSKLTDGNTYFIYE